RRGAPRAARAGPVRPLNIFPAPAAESTTRAGIRGAARAAGPAATGAAGAAGATPTAPSARSPRRGPPGPPRAPAPLLHTPPAPAPHEGEELPCRTNVNLGRNTG